MSVGGGFTARMVPSALRDSVVLSLYSNTVPGTVPFFFLFFLDFVVFLIDFYYFFKCLCYH